MRLRQRLRTSPTLLRVQNDTKRTQTIVIRIDVALNDALQRVADRESNTRAATARRLIALGLQREARERARDEAQTSRQQIA